MSNSRFKLRFTGFYRVFFLARVTRTSQSFHFGFGIRTTWKLPSFFLINIFLSFYWPVSLFLLVFFIGGGELSPVSPVGVDREFLLERRLGLYRVFFFTGFLPGFFYLFIGDDEVNGMKWAAVRARSSKPRAFLVI